MPRKRHVDDDDRYDHLVPRARYLAHLTERWARIGPPTADLIAYHQLSMTTKD